LTREPADLLQPYIDDAVRGDRRPAVRIVLDLFAEGADGELIVDDLLAPAQREVGERWYRNELTVADEHIATGVCAAALDALVGEASISDVEGEGHTVVACAEGDWHSLAAQMFGESLRERGVGVTVLGASTPAGLVIDFLTRRGADSLAVSCSLPLFFPGVTRLVDVAHREGIPVIVGGRALGDGPERARRLGADAWASSAEQASAILADWRSAPPAIDGSPTPLRRASLELGIQAPEVARAAYDALMVSFPAMATFDEEQLARTREDLVFIVGFLAAARLVDDDAVFTDLLDWLQTLLVNRGVSPHALPAGLEALRPGVVAVDAGAERLLDAGLRRLHATLVN
jgi:methanogenic corrinoid protein MtbC1